MLINTYSKTNKHQSHKHKSQY